VKVLIVDDQDPFRDAARAVIDRAKGFEVVAEAASGEEAIETVAADQPDLILMDINMGGMSGIEATKAITAAHPNVTVFLLSTYSLSDLPPDANECGAAAYLNNEEFGGRLLKATWESGGQDGWRQRIA
jgi:DNA-binding NarL/FixJ family response regulator